MSLNERLIPQEKFIKLSNTVRHAILTYELSLETLRKTVAAHELSNPVSDKWYTIGHGPDLRRIFIPEVSKVVFHADNQQDLIIRQENDGIFVYSDALIHILPRATNAVKLISKGY